jgi:lipopolysaccharide transport system permease protein
MDSKASAVVREEGSAVSDSPTVAPTVVIQPPKSWVAIRFRELWAHRELFWMFAWRDLTVRYKQTGLGVAWAVLSPFLTMVVFSLVFGRLAGLGSTIGGLPYPVFTFTALLPWNYFSQTMTKASNSLVDSAALVTKVYFPRLLLPLSTAVSGLVDLAIAFLVLLGLMIFYHLVPTVWVVALPLFILLASLFAMGVGLWLAALNVEYRDVKFLVPFFVQTGMYLSPVVYPVSRVPVRYVFWYSLNPMVGVIEGFRWAILGNVPFPVVPLLEATLVVVPLLLSGLYFFRHMERVFADVV